MSHGLATKFYEVLDNGMASSICIGKNKEGR